MESGQHPSPDSQDSLKSLIFNYFGTVKINLSDSDYDSLLAVKPGIGVFRMEMQSAVNFKVKTKQQLAFGLLAGLGILLLIVGQLQPNLDNVFSWAAGAVTGVGVFLFLYALRNPVIRFTEKGFYFKPALISKNAFYAFDSIQYILPSDSNHTVRFQMDDGRSVCLMLNHLNPKDHIRFIFLLESDVNRKHVRKSVAAQTSS